MTGILEVAGICIIGRFLGFQFGKGDVQKNVWTWIERPRTRERGRNLF